jgi:hypothetical protein
MVLIAKQTTYAVESVGGGVDVRRRVVAGQQVPDWWEIDKDAVEEVDVASGIAPYQPQITMRVDMDAQGDIAPVEGGGQPGAEEAEEAEPHHARRSRKAD